MLGLGGLVVDDYNRGALANVRPLDISFAKCKAVLKGIDAGCDVRGDSSYDEEALVLKWEHPAENGDAKEISCDLDFHLALGVLDFYAGYDGRSVDLIMTASSE